MREGLLVSGSLVVAGLIALLDYATGPDLSFGFFYLLPVAACAWWGGFPHGILLAVAGAAARFAVARLEMPDIPLAAHVGNGVLGFCTLALLTSLVSRLRTAALRESRLARTDPLTGAANGRTFYEAAGAEAERARRTGRPLTLAYLDLDNFKQLNDRHGHAAGDAALVQLARSLRAGLRDYDVLARLGGDEFALMLPEADGEGAAAVLSRVHRQLAEEMAARGWPLTASVGAITFVHPWADLDLMVGRIDALMYEAKRKGKGRIEHLVLAGGPPATPEEGKGADRRATARILCDRAARVRPGGEQEAPAAFAVVRDVSAGGVGLLLESPVPLGTLLVVEPLSPGSSPLLARVVRVVSEGSRWRHGCELSARLGDEEIRRWQAGPAEADAAPT